MSLSQYNEFFTGDYNINGVLSVRQCWERGDRVSFLAVGRQRHGLLLLTNCSAVLEFYNGTQMQCSAGDLLFLPRGAHYAISFPVPSGQVAQPMLINFDLCRPDGSQVQFDCDVQRLCRDDGRLLPQFTAAAQFYKNAASAKLKAAVYALLGDLFPIAEADECGLSYINRHYTDKFSVPQLAARCALSQTAYRKHFRQATGLSPIQYINRLKVEKACQMLRSGDIGVDGISEFLGFYSVPYFYKVFKDITGMTPHQYRDVAEPTPAERGERP